MVKVEKFLNKRQRGEKEYSFDPIAERARIKKEDANNFKISELLDLDSLEQEIKDKANNIPDGTVLAVAVTLKLRCIEKGRKEDPIDPELVDIKSKIKKGDLGV